MKSLKKLLVLSLFLLLITGCSASASDKMYQNDVTMSAKVMSKQESNGLLLLEVVDINDSKKTGKVTVKSENVWNLIEENRDYFMVLTYRSNQKFAPIFSEGEVKLQQVEHLK